MTLLLCLHILSPGSSEKPKCSAWFLTFCPAAAFLCLLSSFAQLLEHVSGEWFGQGTEAVGGKWLSFSGSDCTPECEAEHDIPLFPDSALSAHMEMGLPELLPVKQSHLWNEGQLHIELFPCVTASSLCYSTQV